MAANSMGCQPTESRSCNTAMSQIMTGHGRRCKWGHLQKVLTEVELVIVKWSSAIRTSSLPQLSRKEGSNASECLKSLKADLEGKIEVLEVPLGMVVAMHATKLKKMNLEGKPKAKAKAKQ